jgi:hypothetical protein
MTAIRPYFIAISVMATLPSASAFTPDVVRGCKVIAQAQKNPSAADAVHAAYCLGLVDGIFTSISKQQTATPLPDPCFNKTFIPPSELAEQVVRVLTEQPKISELGRTAVNDRGAMATYLALAVANKCSTGAKVGR